MTPEHTDRNLPVGTLADLGGEKMAERTDKDYAIEHAGYMATAARHLMERMDHEFDASEALEAAEAADAEDAAEKADDLSSIQQEVGEARRTLSNRIYEFEKRRDRALQPPPPAVEVPTGTHYYENPPELARAQLLWLEQNDVSKWTAAQVAVAGHAFEAGWNTATALAAAPQVEAPGGWKPIASAPKHTEVLCWREDQGVFISQLTVPGEVMSDAELEKHDFPEDFEEWFNEAWGWQEGSERPTHWQPLPAAPSAAAPSLPAPAVEGASVANAAAAVVMHGLVRGRQAHRDGKPRDTMATDTERIGWDEAAHDAPSLPAGVTGEYQRGECGKTDGVKEGSNG